MSLERYRVLPKIKALHRWLIMGHTITGLEAIKRFNYYRLSDGIHKLRKKGVPIKTHIRNGYAVYYIPRKEYIEQEKDLAEVLNQISIA